MAFLLLLLISGCSNLPKKPAWVTSQLKDNRSHKYYLGRSYDENSKRQGIAIAEKDAYHQIIQDNFGTEAESTRKIIETINSVYYRHTFVEASTEVILKGMKKQGVYFKKTGFKKYDTYVLFKISRKEISDIVDQINSALKLRIAVRLEKSKTVKKIISSKNINLDLILDKDSENLLGLARDSEVYSVLLEAGINPNIQDDNGQTELHRVVTRESNITFVKLLIKYGADLNIQDKVGNTPLHLASHWDIYQFLLKNGANPNVQNNDGETPLHSIVYSSESNISYVKLLLKYEADPNIQNNKGEVPLHVAEHFDVYQTLLKYKASPNIQDKSGRAPIHTIAQNCNEYVGYMKLLLEYDAYLDIQDKDDNTPLHYAVWKGDKNIECIKLLVNYNASQNIQNVHGDIPLDFVRDNNNPKSLSILLGNSDEKSRNISSENHSTQAQTSHQELENEEEYSFIIYLLSFMIGLILLS